MSGQYQSQPNSSKQRFLQNVDVVENLIIYVCHSAPVVGPPSNVFSLAAACKLFALTINHTRRQSIYDHIFDISFGSITKSSLTQIAVPLLPEIWKCLHRFKAVAERQTPMNAIQPNDWIIAYELARESANPTTKSYRQLTQYARVWEVSTSYLTRTVVNDLGRTSHATEATYYSVYIWWKTFKRGENYACYSSYFSHFTYCATEKPHSPNLTVSRLAHSVQSLSTMHSPIIT